MMLLKHIIVLPLSRGVTCQQLIILFPHLIYHVYLMRTETPFSISQLTEAVKLLTSNKSPGEVGFTPDFYKEFQDLLTPPLMEILKLAREEKQFPGSFSQAIISIIHKPGKAPQKGASYRQISLVNTDYKLATKTISRRLETNLPSLVNSNQTGFIINRLSANNFFVFLIIYLAKKNNIPSLALSLNSLEKALDRPEYPYLFRVLQKCG